MQISYLKRKLQNRQENYFKNHQHYAVLVPILVTNNQPQLLFEVRSMNLRHQPGEVSFPGGKVEPNETWQQAACRETIEELGISASSIEWLGALDIASLTPRRTVHAGVAIINTRFEFLKPCKSEVAELFTVPLDYFLTNNPDTHCVAMETKPNENFPYHKIPNGKQYSWHNATYDVPFYEYENRIIWGLTARIIVNLIDLLK